MNDFLSYIDFSNRFCTQCEKILESKASTFKNYLQVNRDDKSMKNDKHSFIRYKQGSMHSVMLVKHGLTLLLCNTAESM